MSDFEGLKELRKVQRGQFTRWKNKCDDHLKGKDAAQGMSTVFTLRHKFSKLEEIEKDLIIACELRGKDLSEFIVTGDEYLCERLTEINILELAFNQLSANVADKNSVTNSKRVSLPKLQLPKFAGDLLEWCSFWDLFKSTVDEQRNLTPVEKFSHLKCHLVNEAKQTIEGLPLTSINYEKAKELLENRFGQAHKITEANLDQLIELNSPNYNLKSLRQFYDKIEMHIRSLDS
ncbi:uncharacterized protein LOC141910519 [Tubulanus polymorphus]|uniref:uncharacterized protein LOC141910519 n=1 Tax=Tubulanus polymorphus TaxID=672921 RepID=UPI003DA64A9D